MQKFFSYIYGNNNPLNYIDPQGTIAFLTPVVMGALTLYSAYQTGKALAEGDYKRAAFEAIGLIPVGKVGTLAVKGALKIAPKLVSKGKTLLTAGKNVAKGVVTFAKESGVGKSIASGISKFASGMDKAASAVSDFGRRLFGEPICFIEGTLILTDEGYDEIQNIEAGDLVLSSNPDTGETAYKEVVNVFVNESWELFHVSAGNEVITTTAAHPFWVEDRGFVPAGMLAAGDMLRLSSGTAVAVGSIERELLDEPVTVYNFEVADWHTYFVSEMGVLVHNTCWVTRDLSGRTISSPKLRDYFKVSDEGLGSFDIVGGHHLGAKIAFKNIPEYNVGQALAVSLKRLEQFGAKHKFVTGYQNSLYTAFAKTGQPFTMEVMRRIETQALNLSGVPIRYARHWVNKAIKRLERMGVKQPIKIPWKRK